ncbi:MAG: hypothetical protein ACLPT6_00675 [Desulfobaccales bacterium]
MRPVLDEIPGHPQMDHPPGLMIFRKFLLRDEAEEAASEAKPTNMAAGQQGRRPIL